MGFRERAGVWLGFVFRQVVTPNILIPGMSLAGTVVTYYAHRKVSAYWVPGVAGLGVYATMLFYRRKDKLRESRKPIPASAMYLGMRWVYSIYSVQNTKPTQDRPFAVCPKCRTELVLPRPNYGPLASITPHPGCVDCDRPGCGFSAPVDGYEDEIVSLATRLIWADWRERENL